MGKNISGVGIDPNITGRAGMPGLQNFAPVHVKAMIVTDLTEESHGNGIGVGLADVITRHLYDKIDWTATYQNVITSAFLDRGKTPLVAASPRAAFDIALRYCGHIPAGRERVVRIVDTLQLDTMQVSQAVADDLRDSAQFSMDGGATQLFASSGDLLPL